MKVITSFGDKYDPFRAALASYCKELMDGVEIYHNPGSNEHGRNLVVAMPTPGPRIRVTIKAIKFNLFDRLQWRGEKELAEEQLAMLDCKFHYNERDDLLHLLPQSLDSFGDSEKEMIKRAMYYFTIIQCALKFVIYGPN